MMRFIVQNGAEMEAKMHQKSIKIRFWCELCVRGVLGVTRESFFEHFLSILGSMRRAFGAQVGPKKRHIAIYSDVFSNI